MLKVILFTAIVFLGLVLLALALDDKIPGGKNFLRRGADWPFRDMAATNGLVLGIAIAAVLWGLGAVIMAL